MNKTKKIKKVTDKKFDFEVKKVELKNNAIVVIQANERPQENQNIKVYSYQISIFLTDNVNTLLRRIIIDTPDQIVFTENKLYKMYKLFIGAKNGNK